MGHCAVGSPGPRHHHPVRGHGLGEGLLVGLLGELLEGEVRMLLVEPCGVRNTGDQGGERTAVNDLWI